MDKQAVLERLQKHASSMHSTWREEMEWERANSSWIRRSQWIAVQMLAKMRDENLTQAVVAERMGCSQQYVSKVLKGHENLSLETIVKIENALNLHLFVRSYFIEDDEHAPSMKVAEEDSNF